MGDKIAIVGGSSSSILNAGFGKTTPADSNGGNGDAIVTVTGKSTDYGHAVYTTEVRIDGGSTGVFDAADISKHYVKCFFNEANLTDGIYEILDITGSGQYLTINYTASPYTTANCDARVGGAVPIIAATTLPEMELQDILDDSLASAAANDVVVHIYDEGGAVPTAQIDIDVAGNAGTGGYRLTLIGCDSSYDELARGSYCEFDPGGTDINGHIFNVTIANVTFKHISAINPSGSNAPTNNEDCFHTTGGYIIFESCYAEQGFTGFYMSGEGTSAIDCHSSNMKIYDFHLIGHGSQSVGCYAQNGPDYDYTAINCSGAGTSVINTVIDGATTGINTNAYGSIIANNTFVNITVACIDISTATSTVLIYNNIFHVADVTNDYAIDTADGGSWYERNNITNITNSTHTGFYSSSSVDSLTFTNTDPLTNITSFNYKPNRGQTVADANVIEKGWSPYFNSATTNGTASIGAFQTYDLPAKSNVDSSDTVYGETGTATPSSGGEGWW